MPRFYAPQPRIVDGILTIEGEEAKHIRKVLRLRPGDDVLIFDGSSKEYEGTIIKEKASSVLIRIREIHPSQNESPIRITLAQSLLKGEKMDYLIQKSTELGVKGIVPFFSSRSVPLLMEKSRSTARHRRWEKIAIEASKQCGRGVLPQIMPLMTYSEMLKNVPPNSVRLLFWEREGEHLKEVLEQSDRNTEIFFIVGPEGGLSQEEVDAGKREDFIPVNLGRRILRSETAAVCLLGILQYELGDMG